MGSNYLAKNRVLKRTRTFVRIVCVLGVVQFASGMARASSWTGGNGNWSSNGSPGWNSTGVPDAVGAVASKSDTIVATTTVDGSARTVGTLTIGGSTGNATWTFTLTNAITLNQDGASAGTATISDTNSGTGTTRISLGSGTVTMGDDLLISNTSGSTNSIAIAISSTIMGAGNLTISNVSNDVSTALINLTGSNSFTGNVLIQKGVVSFSQATGLGNAANIVTLGSAGNSTTLVTSGSTTNFGNAITVAATIGTNMMGSTSAATTSNSTFGGPITLNGDLTLTSSKGVGADVRFTGGFSGAGALTKIGTGLVRLSGTNTYQGGTTVLSSTLQIASGSSLGTGNVVVDGTAGGLPILELDTSSSIADDATLTLKNGGTVQLKFASGNTESIGVLNLDGTIFNTPTMFSQSSGFVVNGVDYSSYFAGSTSGVTLQVIPEPTTAGLFGLMLVGVMARRRGRHHSSYKIG